MSGLYRFGRFLAKWYYRIFFKLELEGLEHIDFSNPYIICANHIHLQDPFVVAGIVPIPIRFMGKKELFEIPVIGFFLKRLGVIPVDREANDIRAIKASLGVLKNKETLGLFPEGTRNKGYTPLPVKAGLAMLSVKTGTPILPVTIDGTYRWGRPLRVVFHAPVSLATEPDKKLDTEDYERLSSGILQHIYADLRYYIAPPVDKK